MKLIVGLGNIGKEYVNTRHNIGFMILDHLAERHGCVFRAYRDAAAVCKIDKLDWFLAKPATYMNLSGGPVQRLMQFYKIGLSDLIVIHDDIDLPLATIRTKCGGGSAGHNGIKSIDQQVSNNYWRIRFGVGRPGDARHTVSDYVLARFSADELTIAEEAYPVAVQALEVVAAGKA
jgi:PTH1 family peptidyl-tRNA hydrolase